MLQFRVRMPLEPYTASNRLTEGQIGRIDASDTLNDMQPYLDYLNGNSGISRAA